MAHRRARVQGAAFVLAAALVAAGVGPAVAGPPLAPLAPAPQETVLPEPDVWEPPEEVNHTPLGGAPQGSWSYSGDEDGAGVAGGSASSAVALDADVPAPGLGVQSFYEFTEFALTDRESAAVNLANGNLVVRSNDVGINGPGLGLALDRFYNGLSQRDGAFGRGWSLSGGHDVGLEVSDDEVLFRGPSGFRATFTREDDGSFTAPAGLNADLEGDFVLTYHRSGEKLVFDSFGNLLRQEDRNGNAVSYGYYHGNTIISVTDAAGRATDFTISPDRVFGIEDPAGRTTTYTYGLGDRQLQSVTAAGGTTGYTYDGQGRLRSITTPGGVRTEFTYDSQDRVASVERLLQRGSTTGARATTTFAYTAGQTVVTDPAGSEATYEVDDQGRVTSTTDPLGRTHSQTWTTSNAVATATDAMADGGNVATYEYDDANNPTAVVLPTGAAARATYATGGPCGSTDENNPHRAKCTTDPAGNQTSYTYDEAGNLLSLRDTTDGPTGGREHTHTYQGTDGVTCGGKPGQPCSATDGEGNTTTYSYDSDGNLIEVTPPAPLGATTYTYDAIGRVTTVTDGKGQRATYHYDARDRLTYEFAGGNGGRVVYEYDRDGHLLSQTEGNTLSTALSYVYDTRGNIARQTLTSSANTPIVMAMTHDIAGNLATYTDDQGTVTYTYDDAHQLTSVQEPGGTCPTSGGPVPAGAGCVTFAYDDNGAEIQRNLPGGATLAREVDESGRPKRITLTDHAGQAISDYSYSYTAPDSEGEEADRTSIQSRTDHRGIAAPAGSTTSYTYDTLDQLTQALETLPEDDVLPARWEYSYDLAGNRTSAATTPRGGGLSITTWTYNAANQITGQNHGPAWTYDANGNLTSDGTWTLDYNGRDQYTRGDSPTESMTAYYVGSTNTHRIGRLDNGAARDEYHSPLGLAIVDTRSGPDQGTKAITRTPTGAPLSIRHNGDETSYITLDYQGSPTATTTATGQEDATFAYDPYGNPRGDTQPLAGIIGYAGGLEDPSGLVKFGARYYDPTTARFTQMDPAGEENNPYAYALNNPINYIDPTGTSALAAFGNLLLDKLSAATALANLGNVLTETNDAEQRDLAAELAINFGVSAVCYAAASAATILTVGAAFWTALSCEALGYVASQGV